MISSWLVDRGSAKMVTRGGGEDYLWRAYLFAKESGDVRRVLWHTFYQDDPDPLHNHPWPWGRIIVRGRYREHYIGGGIADCSPGHVVRWRPAETFHRVELLTPSVSTIFWHGERCNTWGFMHEDGFHPAPDSGQDGRETTGVFLPRKLGNPPKEIEHG